MDLEMTRRGFISRLGGLGMAGIIAAGRAPAAIVRSALGSRGIVSCEEAGDWQNPYVTEGLIAQWDGEWNGGIGRHKDDTNVWVDLAGNYDFSIGSGYFGSNFYALGGLNCAINDSMPDNVATIEIVCRNKGSSQENIIWATDKTGGYVKQICWVYRGCLGFGYYGHSHSFGSSINSYACTFSASTLLVPDVTYFNGEYRSYGGYQDLFSVSGTRGGMMLNPRYGTAIVDIFALRLYSRVLSADEVAYNYSIDQERFGI